MSPYYAQKTVKGYDLFECASAFQKSVRRGEEEIALYFAVELFNSGNDAYLWKRMFVILSEDIGLAEPHLPATIRALYDTYLELKKKNDEKHRPEKLMLIHAVLLMVRAKKSRLVDWALCAAFLDHDETNMPIPDYALDKHTQKGKAMGRGWDHFFTEGSKLNNTDLQPGEKEYEVIARNALLKGKRVDAQKKGQADMFDDAGLD